LLRCNAKKLLAFGWAKGGGFDGASLFHSELLFDMRHSLERDFRIFVNALKKQKPNKIDHQKWLAS